MKVEKLNNHEYVAYGENDNTAMLIMPRRHCNFNDSQYVFLFKPSKNTRLKTKVVIKKSSGCLHNRLPIECVDGKTRVVSVVGSLWVAGNVFNQRGESLGPNNKDYYIKDLDFQLNPSEYDIRFTKEELEKAIQYNFTIKNLKA